VTYLDDELSTSDGSRTELFEFIGPGTTWRRTSAAADVVYGGNTYTARAGLRAGVIGIGTTSESAALELSLPVSDAVISAYGFGSPQRSLRLKVIWLQERSGAAETVWDGEVIAISPVGAMASLRSVSQVGARLSTPIPAISIQRQCQHFLYDDRCRVDRAAFDVATTVSSISGYNVTVASVGGNPDDWFKAGEIVRASDGERRTIVGNVGAVLSLIAPFATLNATDSVTLYAGCAHTVEVCRDKFSNVLNYGGHAQIPSSNPFDVPLTRLTLRGL